uniref:Uncharacterized protein n=1 Tax=Romanomermis culicivorax TaxID=13658 RepID=A0A915HIS1_ROMCU
MPNDVTRAQRPSATKVGTQATSAFLDVNGLAILASASERLIPAWAAWNEIFSLEKTRIENEKNIIFVPSASSYAKYDAKIDAGTLSTSISVSTTPPDRLIFRPAAVKLSDIRRSSLELHFWNENTQMAVIKLSPVIIVHRIFALFNSEMTKLLCCLSRFSKMIKPQKIICDSNRRLSFSFSFKFLYATEMTL